MATLDSRGALRAINSLKTQDELLNYVQIHHQQLDTINLATILYRLARLFTSEQSLDIRAATQHDLLSSPHLHQLLKSVTAQLEDAQLALQTHGGPQGLNAWCLSNLLWALVKLEACEAKEDVAPLALEAATAAAPLVIHFLPECSGQGVGNLLWSYVQIPGSPSAVLLALLSHVITLLEGPQAHVLDAHALAKVLWSLAHAHSHQLPFTSDPLWREDMVQVLLLGAQHGLSLLKAAQAAQNRTQTAADEFLQNQALATIAWSFSVVLGAGCGVEEPVKELLIMIRSHALSRMRLLLSGGNVSKRAAHSLSAGFNGLVLSHLVTAFSTAKISTPDFLQAVLDVSMHRLSRQGSDALKGFRAEDFINILRAADEDLYANPKPLKQALTRVLSQPALLHPSWSQQDLQQMRAALNMPAAASATAMREPGSMANLGDRLPIPARRSEPNAERSPGSQSQLALPPGISPAFVQAPHNDSAPLLSDSTGSPSILPAAAAAAEQPDADKPAQPSNPTPPPPVSLAGVTGRQAWQTWTGSRTASAPVSMSNMVGSLSGVRPVVLSDSALARATATHIQSARGSGPRSQSNLIDRSRPQRAQQAPLAVLHQAQHRLLSTGTTHMLPDTQPLTVLGPADGPVLLHTSAAQPWRLLAQNPQPTVIQSAPQHVGPSQQLLQFVYSTAPQQDQSAGQTAHQGQIWQTSAPTHVLTGVPQEPTVIGQAVWVVDGQGNLQQMFLTSEGAVDSGPWTQQGL